MVLSPPPSPPSPPHPSLLHVRPQWVHLCPSPLRRSSAPHPFPTPPSATHQRCGLRCPFAPFFPPSPPIPFPPVLHKLEPDDSDRTRSQEIKGKKQKGEEGWSGVGGLEGGGGRSRSPSARRCCARSQPCSGCWLRSVFSWQRRGGMCFSLSFLARGGRGRFPPSRLRSALTFMPMGCDLGGPRRRRCAALGRGVRWGGFGGR